MPTRNTSNSSDAELTATLRPAGATAGTAQDATQDAEGDADSPADRRGRSHRDADAALTELYRRHRPAVLAYARTCCRDPYTAEDLASEAFTRTLQAVRSGSGPQDAWRPYLLTAVRHTAAAWSDTARRTELAPDFERWLEETASTEDSGEVRMLRAEDADLVLRAFRSLPERWQSALWHAVVEREPTPYVATLLGLTPSGVTSLTARAREGLREAYLKVHIEHTNTAAVSDDDECRRYSGLLAAAVRRSDSRTSSHTSSRTSRELDRHLAGCARCRAARLHLTELNGSLRTVLPGAVLLWAASAYVTKAAGATATGATGAAAALTGKTGAGLAGKTGAGLAGIGTTGKVAGAAGVAVLALAVGGLAFYPDGGDRPDASPTAAPSTPNTPRQSRSSSPSPEHSEPERPSPSPARPSRTPSASAPPTWDPAPQIRTALRVASTDRCMDIGPADGAQPYETACDGGTSQQWELLMKPSGQQTRIRNRATGRCLTHTGTDEDGAPVRQRSCDAAGARWTYYKDPGSVMAFGQEHTSTMLGLDDWHEAGEGQPHSARIGTTKNYYASESLRFRYT